MSEYVDPSDLTITRDEDGEVIPIDAQAGQLGQVRVRPMSYGAVQKRFGDGQEFDFDSDDLAEIFAEYIIRPDLQRAARDAGYDHLTGEFVEDMYPLAPRDLLNAILEASGVDEATVEATEDGGAAVSVGGN